MNSKQLALTKSIIKDIIIEWSMVIPRLKLCFANFCIHLYKACSVMWMRFTLFVCHANSFHQN